MGSIFPLDIAARSDPGRVRQLNEDAFGVDPDDGLLIVADGLGGYNAGEVASTLAVSSLLTDLVAARAAAGESFDPEQTLREHLERVNRDIHKAATNSSAFEGMATTIVVAWIVGDRLWVAHAGDSRLYRLRDAELEQLTRDHSFSQELLDAGMLTEQEARQMPAKNLVTRALGVEAAVEPEIRCLDLRAGDLLMLCTDGAIESGSAEQLASELAVAARALDDVADRLIALANEGGGRDNETVVLCRVGVAGG
ncbi:MAG: PP2C family protein-serine/threonine phosphatase [Betaproteobacteria bacterium]